MNTLKNNKFIFALCLGLSLALMMSTDNLSASDVYVNQVQNKNYKPIYLQQVPINKRPFIQKRVKAKAKNRTVNRKILANNAPQKRTVESLSLPNVRGGVNLDLSKNISPGQIIILPSVRDGAIRFRGGAIRLPAE